MDKSVTCCAITVFASTTSSRRTACPSAECRVRAGFTGQPRLNPASPVDYHGAAPFRPMPVDRRAIRIPERRPAGPARDAVGKSTGSRMQRRGGDTRRRRQRPGGRRARGCASTRQSLAQGPQGFSGDYAPDRHDRRHRKNGRCCSPHDMSSRHAAFVPSSTAFAPIKSSSTKSASPWYPSTISQRAFTRNVANRIHASVQPRGPARRGPVKTLRFRQGPGLDALVHSRLVLRLVARALGGPGRRLVSDAALSSSPLSAGT